MILSIFPEIEGACECSIAVRVSSNRDTYNASRPIPEDTQKASPFCASFSVFSCLEPLKSPPRFQIVSLFPEVVTPQGLRCSVEKAFACHEGVRGQILGRRSPPGAQWQPGFVGRLAHTSTRGVTLVP